MSCYLEGWLLVAVLACSFVAIAVVLYTFYHLSLPPETVDDVEKISQEWPAFYYMNKYGNHDQTVYPPAVWRPMELDVSVTYDEQCTTNFVVRLGDYHG
jgi:hypothetical protein